MKAKYRAAIIGLGNIAWRFNANDSGNIPLTHAAAYLANEDTQLVGGCSPDAGDRYLFEKSTGIPAYKSITTMIVETLPDIVSICSPTNHHFRHATICMEMGIPMVWLEKPVTENLEELNQLKQKADDGNSTILVNYIRRYTDSYRNLKKLFSENTYGECRQIDLNYSRGLSLNGSHIIDFLFYLLNDRQIDDLEWVASFGSRDNPTFAFRVEDRFGIVVMGSDLPYHNIEITLTCTEGRLAIPYGGMAFKLEQKTEHELFPGFFRLKEVKTQNFIEDAFRMSMISALTDLIHSHEKKKQPESNLFSAGQTQNLIERVKQWQTREKK